MKRSELIEKLMAIGDPNKDYYVVLNGDWNSEGETSSWSIGEVDTGWLPSGVISLEAGKCIRE
jgi:hypothetical protein